jgi:hypothetical protein
VHSPLTDPRLHLELHKMRLSEGDHGEKKSIGKIFFAVIGKRLEQFTLNNFTFINVVNSQ